MGIVKKNRRFLYNSGGLLYSDSVLRVLTHLGNEKDFGSQKKSLPYILRTRFHYKGYFQLCKPFEDDILNYPRRYARCTLTEYGCFR